MPSTALLVFAVAAVLLLGFARSLELDPRYAPAVYNTANLFAREDQIEPALTWLKRAIELRSSLLEYVQKDEDFASLRNTPEFEAMLDEIRKNRPS